MRNAAFAALAARTRENIERTMLLTQRGMTAQQIAWSMEVSARTVERYRSLARHAA